MLLISSEHGKLQVLWGQIWVHCYTQWPSGIISVFLSSHTHTIQTHIIIKSGSLLLRDSTCLPFQHCIYSSRDKHDVILGVCEWQQMHNEHVGNSHPVLIYAVVKKGGPCAISEYKSANKRYIFLSGLGCPVEPGCSSEQSVVSSVLPRWRVKQLLVAQLLKMCPV